MSDLSLDELEHQLTHALLYYASPSTYFAVSLARIPKTDPQHLGDIVHDMADEVSGSAATIKPGQIARAAFNKRLVAVTGETAEPIDFDEVGLRSNERVLFGVDFEQRQRDLRERSEREDAERELREQQEAEQVEYHPCCITRTSRAIDVPFSKRPKREDDLREDVNGYMPAHCPLCGVQEQGGEKSAQPWTAMYLCGLTLMECGHGYYINERDRQRCEYGQRLKAQVKS